MMTIDLVTKRDPEYVSVCTQTALTYQNTLGVQPASLPETFVSLFDKNSRAIGNVGIWHGSVKPRFLTELYCCDHLSAMYQQYYTHGVTGRHHLAEACSYNVLEAHRNSNIPVALIAFMFKYLYHSGVRVLALTEAVTITRLFRSIGVRSTYICHAKARHMAVSDELRALWERIYFNKLKPKCGTVSIEHAYYSCLKRDVYADPTITIGDRFRACTAKSANSLPIAA